MRPISFSKRAQLGHKRSSLHRQPGVATSPTTVIGGVQVIPSQTKPNIQHRQDMRMGKPSAFAATELLAPKRSSPCRQSGIAIFFRYRLMSGFYSVKTIQRTTKKTLRAKPNTSDEREMRRDGGCWRRARPTAAQIGVLPPWISAGKEQQISQMLQIHNINYNTRCIAYRNIAPMPFSRIEIPR